MPIALYRGISDSDAEIGRLLNSPLVAHCHFGLSKIFRRTGKYQEAREFFGTASAMFREMDMGFWASKAEVDSATQV